MYAHEYGQKHLKHKTNFNDLVVFSDVLQNKINDTTIASSNMYLEIEKGVKNPDKWFVYMNSQLSGEYGDFYLENNPIPEGEVTQLEYEADEENDTFFREYVADFSDGAIPYYQINEKFYIKVDGAINLDEIFLDITVKSKITAKETVSIEYDAFVTLFVSEDGAQLEHAYQNITKVNAHEVVIFIETGGGTNAFGTVFRVLKGKNVTTLPEVDRIRVSQVARAFGVQVITNELSTMISQELKDTNSYFYLLLNKTVGNFGRVLRWGSSEVLTATVDGLKDISKGIEGLKLEDNRWKTMVDGKENPKFNPLLPKLNADNTFAIEQFTNTLYKTYLSPLVTKATQGVKEIEKSKFISKLIPFDVSLITKTLENIPTLLKDFFETVQSQLAQLYNFINGLLVGLINSIIEFIKSIFDILAMLFGLLNGTIQSTKFFESPSTYLSLFAESFENLIDAITNAFTLTNIKKFFGFIASLPVKAYTAVVSLVNTVSDIEIDPGAIGYYLGFIVGFIASEVVTFFATGGVGNIATGVKKVLQSYKELLKIATKTVTKTVTFGLDTFIKIIRNIVAFTKNIPKYLDELSGFIDDFVASLANVSNQLFKGFEAVLELLLDLGVVIAQKLDPNTGKVLVQGTDGAIYTIKQADKTIFEGTQDAIKSFSKKIDEIRTSGGNTKQKVQSYLDELAESLSIKFKNVLEKRELKIVREKGAKSNISVIDKEGYVLMKGKQEDIDKYLSFMKKSDFEILSKFDEIVRIALKSDPKRFNPLKNALIEYRNNGVNILRSGLKNGVKEGKGLVPDFLHNPQFLFNKDKKFGRIKIKVTGIDKDDFDLCNNVAEKIFPGFKSKVSKNSTIKGYTWHHMDDYNPITGECTMQLVKTSVHTACFPHKGAPGLIELLFGISRTK